MKQLLKRFKSFIVRYVIRDVGLLRDKHAEYCPQCKYGIITVVNVYCPKYSVCLCERHTCYNPITGSGCGYKKMVTLIDCKKCKFENKLNVCLTCTEIIKI